MSSAAAPPRPPPPDEKDLQELYNQVWQGYAQDTPTVASIPISPARPGDTTAQHANGASYGMAGPSRPIISTTTAARPPSPETPRSNGYITPSVRSRGRPLPPTPGQAFPSPRTSMPEAQPYEHHPSTSVSTPSWHSQSTPDTQALQSGSRQLPTAPNGTGSSPTSHRYQQAAPLNGLPPDPRHPVPPVNNFGRPRPGSSPVGSSPTGSLPSGSSRQSTPSHSYGMPTPDIGINLNDPYGVHLSPGSPQWTSASGRDRSPNASMDGLNRINSERPRGALAPQIPGLNGHEARELGLHRTNDSGSTGEIYANPSKSLNGYARGDASRAYSPSQFPSSVPPTISENRPESVTSHANLDLRFRSSSDDIRGANYAGVSVAPSSNQDPTSVLGRSTSTSSTVSSMQSNIVDRQSSVSSANFNNYSPSDSFSASKSPSTSRTTPPSTQASMDRWKSTDSGGSAWSGEGQHLRTPSIAISDSTANPRAVAAAGDSKRAYRQFMPVIPPTKGPLELHDDDEDEFEDEDIDRFFNCALLSHIAVRLRDKVPRGTHVKGGIPYPRAFTGKDIVSTIQSQIHKELYYNLGNSMNDRRAALQVARSLQSQLFFYEVEWGGRVLSDGVEDVFMFLDDQDSGTDSRPEREELPTGVFTPLTKCYSPSCGDGGTCYGYACPTRKDSPLVREISTITIAEAPRETKEEWIKTVEKEVLQSLPESEVNRQTIIHKVISKEEQYVHDLELVDSLFIQPLRRAQPPVIRIDEIDEFVEDVFGNILDLRECNRRLLEEMYVRQREQAPVIRSIGDVFLEAATRFREAYPIYVGHLPVAEKRMKDEVEANHEFRLFLEQCARKPEARRLDLKHFLTRPSEHLQKYPVLLEAIFHETADGNPDADYLQEAVQAIKNLQTVAQLRTFQSAMGKGTTGKLEWHDLVSKEFMQSLPKQERKRQSIIFELIKGEMSYVKDLENIEIMYIRPLRLAAPPIISRDRLGTFINDVFHNFAELHSHHLRLLEKFHEIQREEHPVIHSITEPVFDAALNFREAYMEYIPNYPIAAYRIDDEMANNPAFKTFVDQCIRHADAHRLDMKSFINRPIPRLLRYELLLKGIMDESPPDHEDRTSIPHVLDVIKALGKETEPGVGTAKQKVELWRYNSNLIFRPGETIDMDLLDENRSLVHTGKLLRQPDTGFEWSGWSELFVLLFDNYLVMTKPKEKDGVMKYHVNRRPIPLDLLTLTNFIDPPQTRGTAVFSRIKGKGGAGHLDTPNSLGGANPGDSTDARTVYPFTIHHNGRMGGLWTVYAESAQAREEWKQKLEEAIVLRKVVQESNKVFELETLSADTFLVPPIHANGVHQSWNDENTFTGKVTCSVPFSTADGRGLVAIGCAEGVWIGLRHDSRSMRRVLHLKMVTQCAMLEDFGIFLVLADKSLFAYHIEALVPSTPPSTNATRTPQKLNGNKDVQFFSVGSLHGRTLIIYMKKKGLDSIFRVLEPVVGKIAEKTKSPAGFSRFLGNQRSEWFRVYRDFFLPSESFDLFFLKAKIAILCTRGFEIMDLTDFKSVTIPQREDPRLQQLAKRCEACRPMGMFRSNENEFLLCYDEFGVFVDRHGDPSRTIGTIEWEGTAERAASHPPYVLLFDTRFIEVRHVETGRLVQIIPGNDVRCLWDGRNSSVPPPTTPGPEGWQDGVSQEARVHAVMRAPEPVPQPGAPGRPPRAVAQQVCELVPTIPLYLPGSLSSPNASTYFPQSNSPPRSPRLSHQPSWR